MFRNIYLRMSQPAKESQQMIVENVQSGIDSASTEQPALKRKQ